MKAVIYARYSSDSQREESIDGQIRECTQYCEKNGITIVNHYIDRAFSAKTDNRPEFLQMIKDSAKGNFEAIIVWKLDRFSRNRYDSAHYKALLRKNGVKVVSATENIADGPEGIILESLLEGMAEYYSAELSVKVTRGHTENALKCKYNGGTITFGYKIDEDKHYQLNPETAPVVLEVFQMYDSGVTMQQICDYLNEKGVKSVRGKNVDLNFVRGILHNPRYKGDYVYRDIVIPDGIPQIVSRELYDSVQNILEASKKAPARKTDENAYIFTTKLFCGTCKSYMVGESGTSCTGNKYHYYRCVNTKKKKLCDAKHKSIRKDRLEDVVIGHIKKMLMDDEFVNYLATKAFELQEKESSELPLLRKQLEETEKGIENMLNAIQAGILNDSTKKRLDDLEGLKSELEASIIKEEIRKPTYTFEQIHFYIMSFRDVDTDTLKGRKTLVDHFVNSIVVYDDKILINLNYKKGSKQISFKEIENSGLSSGSMSCLGPYLKKPFKLKGLNGFFFCLPTRLIFYEKSRIRSVEKMAKITMKVSVSMRETFDDFLLFKKSMGLSEKTLRTYKEHLTSIGRHLPIDNSMDSIEQTDLERMISSMRDVGLSANSIQSYTRTLKSFFSWCKEEGIANLSLSRYRAEETIKDTYSDAELNLC